MLPLNKILCGDCLEVMQELPDNCIDMVLTDPPWFISQKVAIYRSMNPKIYKYVGKDISLDFGSWDHFSSEKEYWRFIKLRFKECVRVLKEKGHLISFFDQNRMSMFINMMGHYGMLMRQHLYWEKSNPAPRARKADFMIALEQACWFTKGTRSGAIFNYKLGQQKNFIVASLPNNNRIHPTQKPVSVLKIWISYLSNENNTILDPFLGSGSTAVACKELNRNFIGIENNSKYCKAAEERIAAIKIRI